MRIAAVFAVLVAIWPAGDALGKDPARVEWSKDWPRVRLVEGLDIIALTVGSYAISTYWDPPKSASWQGPILFDGAVRDAFRGRTYDMQSTAASVSDQLYHGSVYVPYLVDVWVVALGIHQSADVAAQMALMNLQSLGLAGVVSLAAERAVPRARPFVGDCLPDGTVRDGSGRLLFNNCADGGRFQSFYSGHAAATATMAGLTCAHHQHLPLYGGGLADLAPCLFMMSVSLTTGVARLVADRHWASDVMLGWGVGAFAGYVLPSLLHYGFASGRAVGAINVAGAEIVPVPQAFPGGAGIGLVGKY